MYGSRLATTTSFASPNRSRTVSSSRSLVQAISRSFVFVVPSHDQHVRFWTIQAEQHVQVVTQMASQQEVFSHEVMAVLPHSLSFFGVSQQVADTVGGPGGRVNEKSSVVVMHLQGNAAAGPA